MWAPPSFPLKWLGDLVASFFASFFRSPGRAEDLMSTTPTTRKDLELQVLESEGAPDILYIY
jgi:hypothetical protein